LLGAYSPAGLGHQGQTGGDGHHAAAVAHPRGRVAQRNKAGARVGGEDGIEVLVGTVAEALVTVVRGIAHNDVQTAELRLGDVEQAPRLGGDVGLRRDDGTAATADGVDDLVRLWPVRRVVV
jgi:hypothetical protein